MQKEAITAYYSGTETSRFGYNSYLPSVTDFPLHYAIEKAFNEDETWTEGMARLYYVLAQDFLYDNPNTNVIFADNHDLSRFYSVMGSDLAKFKMGMAYLLTTRGIPMVYYGTEILMEGEEHLGHGHIRKDFPGGWQGDDVNAFSRRGLSYDQKEAQDFLQRLMIWRSTKTAIHKGTLVHFIPESGVYVYFRIYEGETVMVVLNNNSDSIQMPPLERFDECLQGKHAAFEVITQIRIDELQDISLPPKSARIFEIDSN